MVPHILADYVVISTTRKEYYSKAEKAALVPCAATTCRQVRKAVLTPVCTCVGVHAGQPVTRLPLQSRGSGGRGKPQARLWAHIHRMQDSLETPVAAPGSPTSGPPDNRGCSGEAALSPGGGATGQHPQESSLGSL